MALADSDAVVVAYELGDPHAERASAATSADPSLTAGVRILRVACMVSDLLIRAAVGYSGNVSKTLPL